MTTKRSAPALQNAWPWLALAGLAALLIIAILLRRQDRGNADHLGEQLPFRVLEILSEDSSSVLSYPMNYYVGAFPGDTSALPVSDGELLAVFFPNFSDQHYHTVPYAWADGPQWRIGGDSSFLYLDDRLISVNLDSFPRARQWLTDQRATSWPDLRTISLKSALPDESLAALSELLTNNPGVNIHLDMDNLDTIPPGLTERFGDRLVVNRIEAETLDREAGSLAFKTYPKTGTLFLAGGDTLLSDRYYNNLSLLFSDNRRVVLSNFSVEEMQRILAVLNPEKLMIIESDTLENIEFLRDETELRALEISEVVLNLEGIGELPRLEWLAVRPAPGARGLGEIRRLRYLAVDAGPADLIPILNHNPDLQFLDISRDTLLRDLRPLTALPRLTGLALPVIDSLDLSAIAELPDLRYVGVLPSSEGEEAEVRERVRAYCPDCQVYFSENYFFGICLGSGWLLLLIPLALTLGLGLRIFNDARSLPGPEEG